MRLEDNELQTMVGPLSPSVLDQIDREPDGNLLRAQHEGFVELLDGLGVEVVVADAPDGLVDACFAYDPVFVTGAGAIELRMAKPARQDEPGFLASEVEKAGVPVHARLTGNAHADGGDMFWLDDLTLAVGRGYRTNAEAHRQLRDILAAEGDSQWTFFDGNYQEYEADKKKRLGEEGAKPKRMRYKALK